MLGKTNLGNVEHGIHKIKKAINFGNSVIFIPKLN